MISIFVGVAIIWLAYMTTPLTSYLLGAVSFSFMLYFFIFLLLIGSHKHKAHSIGLTPIKYGGNKIHSREATSIYEQLNQTLEETYHEPDLKLEDIAQISGIRKHKISQVLNDCYEINFPTHLRKFRIQKVKKLIETNDTYTLEAIGEECGFKAKSSFYTAFKKETGMTPLQFKKGIQAQKGSNVQI